MHLQQQAENREHNAYGVWFWNLKAAPQLQRGTSTNKATSPNPSNVVPPTWDQVIQTYKSMYGVCEGGIFP